MNVKYLRSLQSALIEHRFHDFQQGNQSCYRNNES